MTTTDAPKDATDTTLAPSAAKNGIKLHRKAQLDAGKSIAMTKSKKLGKKKYFELLNYHLLIFLTLVDSDGDEHISKKEFNSFFDQMEKEIKITHRLNHTRTQQQVVSLHAFDGSVAWDSAPGAMGSFATIFMKLFYIGERIGDVDWKGAWKKVAPHLEYNSEFWEHEKRGWIRPSMKW